MPPPLHQDDRAAVPERDVRQHGGYGPAVTQWSSQLSVSEAIYEGFESLALAGIMRYITRHTRSMVPAQS